MPNCFLLIPCKLILLSINENHQNSFEINYLHLWWFLYLSSNVCISYQQVLYVDSTNGLNHLKHHTAYRLESKREVFTIFLTYTHSAFITKWYLDQQQASHRHTYLVAGFKQILPILQKFTLHWAWSALFVRPNFTN